MMKNGFNTEEHFQRQWGFVLGQETRSEQSYSAHYSAFSHRNPAGRCRDWWTIKVVVDRNKDRNNDDWYSMRTHVLWSAPTMAVARAKIDGFAQWARSRGFETICDL
jgi:hypothetical protein